MKRQNEINQKNFKKTDDLITHPTVSEHQDLVPTIGILKNLKGFENSGKIIVMTDSDCIDSSSVNYRDLYESNQPKKQTKKCFWLMHKFADIATGKITEDFLIDDHYKLPSDFLSSEYLESDSIKIESLEDFHDN